MRNNNYKTVNWISMVISNLAETDSIAPCTISSSQPPISQEEIISLTATDKTLTRLITYIEQGFPGTRTELPPDLQHFWRFRDMLTVYEGLVFMGERVVVPEPFRSRVLDTLHAAHQGTTSMRLRAERNLF